MEDFSRFDGSGASRGSFIYLPSATTTTTAAASTSALPPPFAGGSYGRISFPSSSSYPYLQQTNFEADHHESGSSQRRPALMDVHVHGHGHGHGQGQGGMDVEAMKAKIMSHPHYSNLLGAFMDCQKVGAPPEVVARLSAMTRELESRPTCRHNELSIDPELDQFMEAYCDMLIKYREEVTRPMQEAMDFLKKIESQFTTLTNTSSRLFATDDKYEGVGSSEEDQDGSGGEAEHPEIDLRAEDKELKHHLLKKYGGYLSSLKQELSKKKKKGKLPKEARQKLLNWWELHYKWPYPSETEKAALAESTGLDQKQINNWFINQRKRHWKPSEDMQFVVMDGYHPHNAAAALFMDSQFMGDGMYRVGP